MPLTTPNVKTPWWVDCHDRQQRELLVVRDLDGWPVCAVARPRTDNASDEQEALANLIALAPELYAQLATLVDMVRRCDAELTRFPEAYCSDDEYDAALDDAQALLDLLADAGWSAAAPLAPDAMASAPERMGEAA